MSVTDWIIDGSLAVGLPTLAWRVRATDHLPKAVVLFIAFGLLSALAWARLDAPDIALVEAAVGAGLTGALLMSALGWVDPEPEGPSLPAGVRVALWAGTAALFTALALALWSMRGASLSLKSEVIAAMHESGVHHPVTAVLLNFRSYDTLLEVMVLLSGAVAAQAHHRIAEAASLMHQDPRFQLLARLLVPGVVMTGGYLLWRGSHAPGGAFQAGVLLAGGGILLTLVRLAPSPGLAMRWARVVLVAGPALFVAIAVAPLFLGRALLEYPPGWAKALIVTLESVLTVSIGLTVVMFFPREARTA